MHEDHRLHKLEIRGFRGLAQLELDALGAFNLLLGANDVGKTSVLEAVFLLGGFANLQLPVRLQNWRNYLVQDFDALGMLVPRARPRHAGRADGAIARPREEANVADLRVLVGDGRRHRVPADRRGKRQRAAAYRVRRVVQISRRLRWPPARASSGTTPPWNPGKVTRLRFRGTLEVSDGDLRGASSGQPAAEPTISTRYVGSRAEYDGGTIAELTVAKKSAQLIRYLRVINPRIQDLAVNGNVVYLDVGLERMIPLNMFGGGMMRAVMMLAPCILGNECILLIDELENGLHHAAMLPLLQALLHLGARPARAGIRHHAQSRLTAKSAAGAERRTVFRVSAHDQLLHAAARPRRLGTSIPLRLRAVRALHCARNRNQVVAERWTLFVEGKADRALVRCLLDYGDLRYWNLDVSGLEPLKRFLSGLGSPSGVPG